MQDYPAPLASELVLPAEPRPSRALQSRTPWRGGR
jgi:hypothetical protein